MRNPVNFFSEFLLISFVWASCKLHFYRELSKETTILLQFKNKELEENYTKQRESMSSVPLIASVLVHIVASVYSSFILPSSAIHFLVIIAPLILTLPIVWISVAESFENVSHSYLSHSPFVLLSFH